MNLDDLDVAMLRRLEESLWRPDVRFSAAKMKELLADAFVEIGASGRVYDRAAQMTWSHPHSGWRLRFHQGAPTAE